VVTESDATPVSADSGDEHKPARDVSGESGVCEGNSENGSCSVSPSVNVSCESTHVFDVKENVDVLNNNKNIKKPKQLSFLHWNVNGLLSKLLDNEFVSFVRCFDFVCLVETFIDEFNISVFSGYKSFCIPAVKFTIKGRRSGGVLCLIKNEYFTYVKQVSIKSCNFVAFIIDKILLGTDKDVLYVCSYVPPEGSPYYAYFDCENGVALLEDFLFDCILTYGDVDILLCGDLNSRTSNVSHYCQDISGISNFVHASHPVTLDRSSQDKVMNNYGKLLNNMCTAVDLCILNGMCYGDHEGCYTYISESGCSVNDYFLMSCDLYAFLSDSCELRVCERIDSDHMPLKFTVRFMDNTLNDKYSKSARIVEKYIWNENCAVMYNDKLSSVNFQERINFAVSLIDSDINHALHVFNLCIKDAAESMKKQVRCRDYSKPRDWFDAECNIAKRNVRKLLNKCRRTLDKDDRDFYCRARREYKHLLKKKKKMFNNALSTDLLTSIKDQQ
jgi:hypothetical protein